MNTVKINVVNLHSYRVGQLECKYIGGFSSEVMKSAMNIALEYLKNNNLVFNSSHFGNGELTVWANEEKR